MDKKLDGKGAQWVSSALAIKLANEHRQPIVTPYDLGVAVFVLYQQGRYKGRTIKFRETGPASRDINNYRQQLLNRGVLEIHPSLPESLTILTNARYKDPIDLVCGIDPFCYVSHLSAMEFFGLTGRIARSTISITTLPTSQWRVAARKKMLRDLGGEENYERYKFDHRLPDIQKHNVKKIGRTTISVTTNKQMGAYISAPNRAIRVSSIGRTFLDMIRQPELCGGIGHVLEVYAERGKENLSLILDDVDRWGSAIDKVRVGYVLEEYAGIKDNSRIEQWTRFAQRGGSRKLDASAPYESKFSAKWCISINVPN